MCSFISLTTDAFGSAICYSSMNTNSLKIESSCFRYCIGNKKGGSIYFISKSLKILNSCFEICYSRDNVDNEFGSVIYSDTEIAKYERNSFLYCGPPGSTTGDSTQYIKVSIISNIDFLNNTKCNNGFGSVGPTGDGLPTACCVMRYSNIVGEYGYHVVMQRGATPTDVFNFNAIYIETIGSQIHSEAKMHIFQSYIFLSSKTTFISGNVTFTNCVGNFDIEGVNMTSEIITAVYHMIRGDGCMLIFSNYEKVTTKNTLVLSTLLFSKF